MVSPTTVKPEKQVHPLRVMAEPGALWLLSCCALAVAVFWPGLASLVDAWATPEYSHGPIIPLVSGFLFLREMRLIPPAAEPVTLRWPGLVVIALGLAVGVIGGLIRIPDIVTYGFILWIAGMVLTVFGFRRGALFWPSVLHLVFMLPLPQFLYWQVSIYLQMVSSQIGVALIQLFEIPVYLDGNIIDLGIYKLQVAEACSGLRYLFPMLSFSYVFALLYRGPLWHRILLLAMAAPITVLMNSFRIGMIGILVNSYGIEHAEGFLHTFEGWIIFIACVAILFAIATLLQQLTRHPKPLSETLDIDFTGMGAELRRVADIRVTSGLLVAALLTGSVALASVAMPESQEIVPERRSLVLFPRRIDGWTGTMQTLDAQIERVLGADDYFSATFSNPGEAAPTDLFMAYYYSQTDGSGIHSPEVCIPAGGWEVSRWQPRTITLSNGQSFAVNRAIIQKGTSRQLVYYWFEQRGRQLTSDYAVKIVTVVDSLSMNRSDGGLVRVITPIGPREAESQADARLQRFLDGVVRDLPDFIPQ